MSAALLAPVASLSVGAGELLARARERLTAGARPLAFWGQPAADPAALTLTMVLEADGRLEALRGEVNRARGFHALTRDHPALHVFEREIFETHGVRPHDHPWLKPVRFPAGQEALDRYPFHQVAGKEVHEVAVGPIHAGVIEPGHFRFQCLGETVLHLEVHLGYQHRGAEALLLGRDPRGATALVETLAGDASVAHAWAHAEAVEALAGVEPSPGRDLHRAIGLELERVGMHLSGLAGLCNDVAFLQGAASYGRLRTTIINSTMLVCGSRFGRGWVRPGLVRCALDAATLARLRENLVLVARDVAIIDARVAGSASLRHRLEGVGVVTRDEALEIGLVGAAARASGVTLDLRTRLPGGPYADRPIAAVVEPGGDCWARAMVRVREIGESLRWLQAALAEVESLPAPLAPLGPLGPGLLAVGVCESWRGEVLHALETGPDGKLVAARAQDPSLRNWHGLSLAVRGAEISDFPICNKSFDLSYCGSDL